MMKAKPTIILNYTSLVITRVTEYMIFSKLLATEKTSIKKINTNGNTSVDDT